MATGVDQCSSTRAVVCTRSWRTKLKAPSCRPHDCQFTHLGGDEARLLPQQLVQIVEKAYADDGDGGIRLRPQNRAVAIQHGRDRPADSERGGARQKFEIARCVRVVERAGVETDGKHRPYRVSMALIAAAACGCTSLQATASISAACLSASACSMARAPTSSTSKAMSVSKTIFLPVTAGESRQRPMPARRRPVATSASQAPPLRPLAKLRQCAARIATSAFEELLLRHRRWRIDHRCRQRSWDHSQYSGARSMSACSLAA